MKNKVILLLLFITGIYCISNDGTRYNLTKAMQEDNAVCLDGSVGVYYLRKGSGDGSNKWIIWHRGGGWCTSLENCFDRSKGELGSSLKMPDTMDIAKKGFLSNDPKLNPQMYNWNTVYLHYCDGNSFSGSNSSSTGYVFKNETYQLHWRGKHILEGAIEDLLTTQGMNNATDIVVSGSSAGGLATFMHCDKWAQSVKNVNTDAELVCMPDSGYFIDYGNYHHEMKWAFEQQNSTSGTNQDCIHSYPEEEQYNCQFAQNIGKFIQTPTFALQSEYDSWQIGNVLESKNATDINIFGQNLTKIMTSQWLNSTEHGVFLSSCSYHTNHWPQLEIDGTLNSQAFQTWYEDPSKNKRQYIQQKEYPCTDCCSPNNIVITE